MTSAGHSAASRVARRTTSARAEHLSAAAAFAEHLGQSEPGDPDDTEVGHRAQRGRPEVDEQPPGGGGGQQQVARPRRSVTGRPGQRGGQQEQDSAGQDGPGRQDGRPRAGSDRGRGQSDDELASPARPVVRWSGPTGSRERSSG